jgi:hypothetical protein
MRFHLLNQLAIDLVDFRLDRRDQCAVICSSRCLCCFEIGVLTLCLLTVKGVHHRLYGR